MSESSWTLIPGTLDYRHDALIAVYKYSGQRGLGCVYWVFAANQTKRTQRNAMCVGGLPSPGLTAEINNRAKELP